MNMVLARDARGHASYEGFQEFLQYFHLGYYIILSNIKFYVFIFISTFVEND